MSKTVKYEYHDGPGYGDHFKLEVQISVVMNQKDQETMNSILDDLNALSDKYLKKEPES